MDSRVKRSSTLMLALSLITSVHSGVRAGAPHQENTVDRDIRGLWVLRTSITSPAAIATVVKAAVDGGYNTLLVQVRSRGDAFYASDVDPRGVELDGQPSTFDPLATILETGHQAGLKIHAWVNINLVSSAVTLPRSRSHVVWRKPEWLMVPRALAPELRKLDPRSAAYLDRLARWTRSQSETVEGLYVSPIPADAQDYTVSVMAGLVRRYALDGVHLDYTRYPSTEFDYGAAAISAFRSARVDVLPPEVSGRIDRAAATDPTAWPRSDAAAWAAFRSDRLTALVERLRATVKLARPAAVFSSAVVPDPVDALTEHLQDWEDWARKGLLDVVCPMAYSTVAAAFRDQVATAMSAAHGQPVWMGIGAWRLPVEQTAEHWTIARRSRVAGVLLFSYDSLIDAGSPKGAYLTQLRPTVLDTGRGPVR